MRAGKLRHKVTIEYRTLTADAYGGQTATWATLDTVWADLESLTGIESWQDKQQTPIITHKVTIRYRADIDPKMRIKYGSRYLNIANIVNKEERNIELALLCREDVQRTAVH